MPSTGARNPRRKTKGHPAFHKRQIKHCLQVKPRLLRMQSILEATYRKPHMQRVPPPRPEGGRC